MTGGQALWAGGETLQQGVASGLEGGQPIPGQGLTGGAFVDALGVDVATALDDLVVQVGARRPSGRADLADAFLLL